MLFGSNQIKVYLKQEEEEECLLKIIIKKRSWLTFFLFVAPADVVNRSHEGSRCQKSQKCFVINTLINNRCTHTILTTQHILRKRLYNNTNNSIKSTTSLINNNKKALKNKLIKRKLDFAKVEKTREDQKVRCLSPGLR